MQKTMSKKQNEIKKIDLKDIPLSGIISMQQLFEFSNRQMHGFMDNVIQQLKEGLIRKSYYDELNENLKNRVIANNDLIAEFDEEVARRLTKTFGFGVTPPSYIDQLVKENDKEIEETKNLFSKEKQEPPIVPLNKKL